MQALLDGHDAESFYHFVSLFFNDDNLVVVPP